jgi:N-acetylmuramic acid 6-phosphate (MurNAc-6-P) etherase
MKLGGRLFYIGAGTSGRLDCGCVECPTFVFFDLVNGIMLLGNGDSKGRRKCGGQCLRLEKICEQNKRMMS